MTEEQLQNFGRAYVRSLQQKTRCYELAAEIADGDLEVVEIVRAQQQAIEALSPLTVGVLILSEWGATIPPDIVAKADCLQANVPGSVEIH